MYDTVIPVIKYLIFINLSIIYLYREMDLFRTNSINFISISMEDFHKNISF